MGIPEQTLRAILSHPEFQGAIAGRVPKAVAWLLSAELVVTGLREGSQMLKAVGGWLGKKKEESDTVKLTKRADVTDKTLVELKQVNTRQADEVKRLLAQLEAANKKLDVVSRRVDDVVIKTKPDTPLANVKRPSTTTVDDRRPLTTLAL